MSPSRPRPRRVVLTLAAALVASVLPLVAASTAAAAPTVPTPVLLPAPSVTPTSVTAGSIATVTGSGCTPNGSTRVYVALLDAAGTTGSSTSVVPAADGTWTAHVTPAVDADPGRYQVSATCDTYSTSATYRPRPVTVTATTAPAWTAQTPALPDVPNGSLVDVDCVSATSCVAVGQVAVAGHSTVLVETWDGTAWSVTPVASPGVAGEVFMSEVDCASATRCVAVGDFSPPQVGHEAFVAVLSGTTWTSRVLDPPTGERESSLSGISCPTTSTCLAVGTTGALSEGSTIRSIAYRLQGTTWSRVADPVTPGQNQNMTLRAISCANAKTCVAVGSYTPSYPPTPVAEVFDGSTWHLLRLPAFAGDASPFLTDVTCASLSSCVAVGSVRAADFSDQPLVLVLTDTTWRQATVTGDPAVGGTLSSVSCVGNRCTAVGATGTFRSSAPGRALAVTRSGSTWTSGLVDLPHGAPGALAGVACVTGSCLAVGTAAGAPAAVRSTGTGWTDTAAVVPSGYVGGEFDAVACSGTNACTAVGFSYDATRSTVTPLVNRWDGTAWTRQDLPDLPDTRLNGVACPGSKLCYAVGDAGRSTSNGRPVVLQWRGSTWTPVPVSGADTGVLEAVSCSAASACLAVGQSYAFGGAPIALAPAGGTWRSAAVPAGDLQSATLAGVSCVANAGCRVTGSGRTGSFSTRGIDLVWDGTSFTEGPQLFPAGAVSCTAATTCVALQSDSDDETAAAVLVGDAWRSETLPDPSGSFARYAGVACRGTLACVAVGSGYSGGLIARRAADGSWTAQPVRTSAGSGFVTLEAVSSPTDARSVAVGHDGAPTIVVSPTG